MDFIPLAHNGTTAEFNPEILGPLLNEPKIFLGPQEKPLLAPRGVFSHQGKLLVADTGQNRVSIWNQLPDNIYQEPDMVLGQNNAQESGRNAGGEVSASSLQYPTSIWTNGQILIIADAWNHRVLIWHHFPQASGQGADVVLGQKDFTSNLPNVEGVGATPGASSLNWPYGLVSDGERLWIADTGNRRVLFYEQIPQQNFQAADGLIGKRDFEDRDYTHQDAVWPYSVKLGPKGELAIADTQFFRVLLWNHWQNAFAAKAEVIIGQENFEANGANQFRLFPEANTLNWCYDLCFYQNGIWVNDTANSRLLWFDSLPASHNTSAQGLIGKRDFQTSSENKETLNGTQASLYWPFSIHIEDDHFFIADTGNHRIISGKLTH
ncbi:MAG: hypothetical protein AAFU64_07505 [Bacteroidota bacterium]